jgi:hypothetical protein
LAVSKGMPRVLNSGVVSGAGVVWCVAIVSSLLLVAMLCNAYALVCLLCGVLTSARPHACSVAQWRSGGEHVRIERCRVISVWFANPTQLCYVYLWLCWQA